MAKGSCRPHSVRYLVSKGLRSRMEVNIFAPAVSTFGPLPKTLVLPLLLMMMRHGGFLDHRGMLVLLLHSKMQLSILSSRMYTTRVPIRWIFPNSLEILHWHIRGGFRATLPLQGWYCSTRAEAHCSRSRT